MPDLDATDARLLLALAETPRATAVEIAQRLGLSRNTVAARTGRWEADALLGPYDRRVTPRSLGYPLSAYVAVRVDQHVLARVVDRLEAIPEVVEAYGMSGASDLTVKVVARDTDDLYRLAGVLLAIPGVERTNMSLVMQEFIPSRTGPLLRRAADDASHGS